MGSCIRAFHKVSFCCIFIRLSTEVFVALLILSAISGLNDDFSFINSDNAFLLTPSIWTKIANKVYFVFTSGGYTGISGYLAQKLIKKKAMT